MAHYWFIATKHRRTAKLALFTCALALVVILLGAYTRLTNAGLSCPDWPNCYGYMTAPHTMEQLQEAAQRYPAQAVDVKKAWTEMTHRYFAGTEGILILVLCLSIFLNRQSHDVKSSITGLILIGLLFIQVLLGMLTVTEKLKPVIVLGHLLTGLSILSILWWTYLNLKTPKVTTNKSNKNLFIWLWIGLGIIATQITLGGWVSTHYAGLACIDFPYCNGQVLPNMQWNNLNTDLITIHMLHRIGAMVTAVYLTLLACYLFSATRLRLLSILIFVLLALQITLGILNIIWLRPVWIALIHHSVAIFLLLTMIFILVKVYREPLEEHNVK